MGPLENGEVYLIKYDNTKPAQIVVGKHAYLRRADRNPEYRGKKSGIVIVRVRCYTPPRPPPGRTPHRHRTLEDGEPPAPEPPPEDPVISVKQREALFELARNHFDVSELRVRQELPIHTYPHHSYHPPLWGGGGPAPLSCSLVLVRTGAFLATGGIAELDGHLYLHDWDEWQEMYYRFIDKREKDTARKRRAREAEKEAAGLPPPSPPILPGPGSHHDQMPRFLTVSA